VSPFEADTGPLTWGTLSTTPMSVVDKDAIGVGHANTTAIAAQAAADGSTAADSAGIYANDYVSSGESDWYLPSKDELNELCKYAFFQATGDSAVLCADATVRRVGFTGAYYWSSSLTFMFGGYMGWWQNFFIFPEPVFPIGFQDVFNAGGNGLRVRPVRAG